MRVLALALGAVAAVGFTAAVAAGQATDHIQLAQAQNTGAQQGAGTVERRGPEGALETYGRSALAEATAKIEMTRARAEARLTATQLSRPSKGHPHPISFT